MDRTLFTKEMSHMRHYVFGFIALTLVLGVAITEEAKSKNEDMLDRFRCEKYNESGMAALKLKLIENCNLDKPFSLTSASDLGSGGYAYCCHLKK